MVSINRVVFEFPIPKILLNETLAYGSKIKDAKSINNG
jgi:hypothetical protein